MRMVMKMAAVSTISVLLLCCCTISSTDSQVVCDRYAATGENFTVPLLHSLEASDSLIWTFNKLQILYRRQGSFVVGSKKDVSENGSLELTNMEKAKAGSYTPEVLNKNGQVKATLRSIHLCVQDRVQKPTVTTQCSPPFVKFTCKINQPKDLNFEWRQNDKVLEKEKGQTLTRKPQDVGTDSFICIVSNHVSSLSSSPVKQTCLSPSTFSFPKTVFGINTWILVGIGGGIVLVLIVSVIVCCVRAKRKKRAHLKDEGELRLAWTNEHQRQHNPPPDHHHHHHHRQQQPAGHTGPRQQRSKPHREQQQRPRVPEHGNGNSLPQPSPRRPAQAPRPADQINDEQPPPLPQPRKKAAKTPRM